MVLPVEDLQKPSFSREKDGFSKDGCSKPSFSREKDGLEQKKSFSRENKKNQKHKKKKKKKHLLDAPAP